MTELTRVPSKLLKIALRDMKLTIKQGFNIDMTSWGSGYKFKPSNCSVCFAGSVMLQTTDCTTKNLANFDFIDERIDDLNYDQFMFLDYIRQGKLSIAMNKLNIPFPDKNVSIYYVGIWEHKIKDWVQYSDRHVPLFVKQVEDLILFFKSIQL